MQGIIQPVGLPLRGFLVVICLVILTFAGYYTTKTIESMLPACCDLLSNSYLCRVLYNLTDKLYYLCPVVICLVILTFAGYYTTLPHCYIASRCCDLLSNSYLCRVLYNAQPGGRPALPVVICLVILTFAGYYTTAPAQPYALPAL